MSTQCNFLTPCWFGAVGAVSAEFDSTRIALLKQVEHVVLESTTIERFYLVFDDERGVRCIPEPIVPMSILTVVRTAEAHLADFGGDDVYGSTRFLGSYGDVDCLGLRRSERSLSYARFDRAAVSASIRFHSGPYDGSRCVVKVLGTGEIAAQWLGLFGPTRTDIEVDGPYDALLEWFLDDRTMLGDLIYCDSVQVRGDVAALAALEGYMSWRERSDERRRLLAEVREYCRLRRLVIVRDQLARMAALVRFG